MIALENSLHSDGFGFSPNETKSTGNTSRPSEHFMKYDKKEQAEGAKEFITPLFKKMQ